MNKPNSCIGIYNTPTDTEHGVTEFQMPGFHMKKFPILGKEYYDEKHPSGFYHTGDRIKSCASGAFYVVASGGLLFG